MPQRIYKDPFRGGDNIIVMCDCYEPPRVNPDGTLAPMKVRPVPAALQRGSPGVPRAGGACLPVNAPAKLGGVALGSRLEA